MTYTIETHGIPVDLEAKNADEAAAKYAAANPPFFGVKTSDELKKRVQHLRCGGAMSEYGTELWRVVRK